MGSGNHQSPSPAMQVHHKPKEMSVRAVHYIYDLIYASQLLHMF